MLLPITWKSRMLPSSLCFHNMKAHGTFWDLLPEETPHHAFPTIVPPPPITHVLLVDELDVPLGPFIGRHYDTSSYLQHQVSSCHIKKKKSQLP